MFKNKSKFYFFLSLLLLPIVGYADFNLRPASRDLSYYILEVFYGHIDGILNGQNAVLAKMFGVFNSVAIIISAIVIIYVVIISTVNTANDGEMLGRKWSSMWIPIKMVVGFVLLIPKASGYSIVQIIIMWIVVMGVGAADRVWETMVNHFASGGSLINAPIRDVPSEATKTNIKLAADILQAEVCTAALESAVRDNQDLVSKYQDTHKYLPSFLDSINTQKLSSASNGTYILYFPGEIKNFEYLKGKCGEVIWKAADTMDFCASFEGAERSACIEYVRKNPNIIKELQANSNFKRAMTVALQSLVNSLKSTANMIVSHRDMLLADPSGEHTAVSLSSIGALQVGQPISIGYESFNQILLPIVKQYNISFHTKAYSDIEKQALNYFTDMGWIVAGSFANNLFISYHPQGAINLVQNYMPTYIPPKRASIHQLGDAATSNVYQVSYDGPLYKYIVNALTASSYNGPISKVFIKAMNEKIVEPMISAISSKSSFHRDFPWPIGTINIDLFDSLSKSTISEPLLDLAGKVGTPFDDIINVLGKVFTFTTINVNVLSTLRVIGLIMIHLSLTLYNTFGITAFVIALVLGVLWGFQFATSIDTLATVFMPAVLAICGFLMLNGAILAFYIPLLPVIVFTFGILGWLVGVFESLIAAPIVAIGIMLPESQGSFMGKSSPATMLLLNLFLRPTLMLFGLIGGLILANIGVWLFLILFFITLAVGMLGTNVSDIIAIFTGQVEVASIIGGIVSAGTSAITNIAFILAGFIVLPVIMVFTVMAIVKKSFALVHTVPDKILLWLAGGMQHQLGGEMSSGADEAGRESQSTIGSAGRKTGEISQGVKKAVGGYMGEKVKKQAYDNEGTMKERNENLTGSVQKTDKQSDEE